MKLRNLTMLIAGFAVAMAVAVSFHTWQIGILQGQVRQLQSQVATMQAQPPNGGGAPAASARTTAAGPDVVSQQLILRWPAKSCDNRFLVEDQNTAPMASVACNGLQSWGEPFCVIIKVGTVLEPNSCLGGPPNIYPGGDQVPSEVTLYLNGKPVNLTPQAVLWVLKAMHIRPRW